jgi:hypothetical protein
LCYSEEEGVKVVKVVKETLQPGNARKEQATPLTMTMTMMMLLLMIIDHSP